MLFSEKCTLCESLHLFDWVPTLRAQNGRESVEDMEPAEPHRSQSKSLVPSHWIHHDSAYCVALGDRLPVIAGTIKERLDKCQIDITSI